MTQRKGDASLPSDSKQKNALIDSAATAETFIQPVGNDATTIVPSAPRPSGASLPFSQIGNYEILGEIARGGMGVVYKARQAGIDRIVALKMTLAGQFAGEEERRRFLAEAQAAGRLDHPNIVPIYEVGEHGGQPYLSMGYVEGQSLKVLLADGPLPQRQAAELTKTIAEAVHFAHTKGIVHRDLKPANVLIDESGQPRVTDFGLAKLTTTDSSLTATGQILGTPSFMPPEQAMGNVDQIGPLSDVYSLGATLYNLLTGRPPFQAATVIDTLMQVMEQEPVPPRQLTANVSVDLETTCMKCLQKDISRRYASAGELAEELGRFLRNEPIHARPVGSFERARRWCRRNPIIAGWTAAAAMLFIAVVMVSTIAYFREATLASEKSNLAQTNGKLARDADTKRQDAERTSLQLRIELARSAFTHGMSEYDAGRLLKSERDLLRAVVLLPANHETHESYARIAWDRMTRGGRSCLPALWHGGRVDSASFSADGMRILTLSMDHTERPLWWAGQTAQLWDAQTGTAVGEPHQFVGPASFSPDGTRVLTRDSKGTPRLWDARTGVALGEGFPHEALSTASFGPDGTCVLTLGGGAARVWNARTGAVVGELRQDVWSASFSPDGTRILTHNFEGTARLWDARTGAALGEPLRHEGSLRTASFSPDGTRVVTASWDKTARLWDAWTGVPGNPLRHQGNVDFASFSPDGTRIVTLSLSTARLWDAKTGTAIGEPLGTAVGSVSFGPDGTRIVTVGGRVELWDAVTGAAIGKPLQHDHAITCASFSPDGTRIVTAGMDHVVRFWNARTGAQMGQPLRHDGTVNSAAFSPDGTRVVTASWDGTARLWDARIGATGAESLLIEAHALSALFSPNGTRIIVLAHREGIARLFDAGTRAPVGEPLRHESLSSASFSPNDTRIITVGDNMARLWDARSGAALGEPLEGVRSASFSADGTHIVTSSQDNVARLWSASTGRSIGQPIQHQGHLSSASFSPNGTQIVTVGEIAQLWDALTGAAIGGPLQHETSVTSAAFSPDGMRVVTAGGNEVVRLWDARTGAAVAEPLRHIYSVSSASFSADGMRILTVGSDSAQLWDARSGTPVGEALLSKGLPKGEWYRFREEAPHQFSATFNPDGTQVITVSGNDTAQLWDARTAAPVGEPLRHDYLHTASFSRDGTRVVTTGSNTAQLWDARTGAAVGEPLDQLEHNTFFPASFSRDGTHVVTASGAKTALLWDIEQPIPVNEQWLETLQLFTTFRVSSSGLVTESAAVDRQRRWIEFLKREKPWWRRTQELRADRALRWHVHEANDAESAENWYAAAFHLGWLIRLNPDDAPLKVRHKSALSRLSPALAANVTGRLVPFDNTPAEAELPTTDESSDPHQ